VAALVPFREIVDTEAPVWSIRKAVACSVSARRIG
jgi:hypothetical protein